MSAKADLSGLCPVFLVLHYNGRRFRFYTKKKCLPSEWNEERMLFRKSYPNSQGANDYLRSLQLRVIESYDSYMTAGVLPSPSMLKSDLLPDQDVESSKTVTAFLPVFKGWVKHCIKIGIGDHTVKNYLSLYNHLDEFLDGKPLDFKDFNQDFFDAFLNYKILQFDYHPNTIWGWAKELKTFIRYCKKDLKLDAPDVDLTYKYIETEKIFLTTREFARWRSVVLDEERLDRVRDCFTFACVMSPRDGDLRRFKESHLVEHEHYTTIDFIPNKSLKKGASSVRKLSIPITPIAQEIIEKYRGQYSTILPMYSNQKMNEHLKTIGELAGINKLVETAYFEKGKMKTKLVPKYSLITMHISRHTFATQSLMMGMGVEVLQKVLGHKKLETTMIYAKICDEYKNQEMLRVWSQN